MQISFCNVWILDDSLYLKYWCCDLQMLHLVMQFYQLYAHSFLFISMAIQQRDHGHMCLRSMTPIRTSISFKGMTGTLYQLSALSNVLYTSDWKYRSPTRVNFPNIKEWINLTFWAKCTSERNSFACKASVST